MVWYPIQIRQFCRASLRLALSLVAIDTTVSVVLLCLKGASGDLGDIVATATSLYQKERDNVLRRL